MYLELRQTKLNQNIFPQVIALISENTYNDGCLLQFLHTFLFDTEN